MIHNSSGPLQLDLTESVPLVTLPTLIGTAAIATNSLIVDAMCKHAQHRKVYDVFMLHSSLVDLLTVIVVIPFWIFSAIHGDIHLGNDAFCEICATASFMALVGPISFLTLVAASRHCAVVDKKRFLVIFKDSRARIMVAVAWIVSGVVSTIPHFTWPAALDVLCLPDLMTNTWYTIAVLAFCVTLPLSAAFYAHVCDLLIISLQLDRTKRNDSTRKRGERDALRGSELTTQKAFFGILLIHTLCWAPYMGVAMVLSMNGGKGVYIGKFPLQFLALVFGLTGMPAKGIVSCFAIPHLKRMIKKQFGLLKPEEQRSRMIRV